MATGAFVAALLLAPGSAQADDILDQIAEAIAMYKEGDYSGAIAGLDFASTQIRQLLAGQAADALPAPLPGWEAEDAETTAMSGTMFGGGISAERTYRKGDAEVDVQLLGESPMLQGMMMMFNNPMIMSGSGKSLKRIKGHKAAVEYDGKDRSGEIMMIVAGSVMITVRGSDVSQEDLTAYAEAIDFELLGKLASGN
jgi:hypothetical protein